MPAYTRYKVVVPFYKPDRSSIKHVVDMIFVNDAPIAVMTWRDGIDGRRPCVMITLDRRQLVKSHTGEADYEYLSVMSAPQPNYWSALLPR